MKLNAGAMSDNARRAFINAYIENGGLPVWMQHEIGDTIRFRALPSPIDGGSPFMLHARHNLMLGDQTKLKWACAMVAGTDTCPVCDWVQETINPTYNRLKLIGRNKRSGDEEQLFKKASVLRRAFGNTSAYFIHAVSVIEGLEDYQDVQLLRIPKASFEKQLLNVYEDGNDFFDWDKGKMISCYKKKEDGSGVLKYT